MTTLSLNVPNFGTTLAADSYGKLVQVCQSAESAGFDRVLVTDHVVMGSDNSAYTWSAFPTEPDANWLEPLSVLAFVAGQTTTIRLGTGIVIAALRGGAVLAKTAATIDLLSRGRLDLGVGTGWQEREYDAAGIDFGKRGPLLDDALAICRALWTSAPASIDTPRLKFDDVYCAPRPATGIPIWVSGSLSKAVVRRVATWGDGWIPIMGATNDDLREGGALIRKAMADLGRDASTLDIRGRLTIARASDGSIDLRATMLGAEELVEAGATDVLVALGALDPNPDEAVAVFGELASAFKTATG
ncbi:UNVERIFIED_ORG: putative F420-dependent oxidoreductase [Nocardia globerula]|uniref:Putative F420-dependent oxidoreductase n=1 Tax=Nocardia globerula TaxID=1818 RepID=A0A652YSC2_NOCGL|nr:TIGR03619 family F420-dependent LLM class oxidoreductase [Rhodococcus globerulus]NMD61457.1 TIGR03619 family F420-dependent LLM class oxidoreductase [Nocardia globerula]PVX66992.1 putative F420-dependent oxidoreductase [Rhodococcus globerulus]